MKKEIILTFFIISSSIGMENNKLDIRRVTLTNILHITPETIKENSTLFRILSYRIKQSSEKNKEELIVTVNNHKNGSGNLFEVLPNSLIEQRVFKGIYKGNLYYIDELTGSHWRKKITV